MSANKPKVLQENSANAPRHPKKEAAAKLHRENNTQGFCLKTLPQNSQFSRPIHTEWRPQLGF